MMQMLTASEVAAFTGLDERSVRKDLEYGIFGTASPPRFSFAAVIYFRALSLLGLHLPTADRKRLYQLIADALDTKRATVEIGSVAELKIGAIKKEVEEKLRRFTEWKRKLVADDAILGGELVFPKSRLAVRHIGAMLLRGAAPIDIHDDYPYLTDEDLEFARLFATAYPRVGRPRGSSDARRP
jgi:uncharacterized protein (DUF433 family)